MCHALIQCPQQQQQIRIHQLPCLKSRTAAELCQGAAHYLHRYISQLIQGERGLIYVKMGLALLMPPEVCSKAGPQSWGVTVPACVISVCDPCTVDTGGWALESQRTVYSVKCISFFHQLW